MTEQKSALEQALDLVVYAPVGLAVTAREELPRLIEKGRQRVTGQVAMARMIGRFAVNQGQHEVNKVAKQAGDTLAGLGIIPRGGAPAPAVADGGRRAAPVAASDHAQQSDSAERIDQADPPDSAVRVDSAEGDGVAAAPAPSGGPTPVASTNGKPDPLAGPPASSGGLAIPGYDSLSASQVVQRLAGLVPAELEAVRDYEASTRGRRTILNRIAQLQTGSA